MSNRIMSICSTTLHVHVNFINEVKVSGLLYKTEEIGLGIFCLRKRENYTNCSKDTSGSVTKFVNTNDTAEKTKPWKNIVK